MKGLTQGQRVGGVLWKKDRAMDTEERRVSDCIIRESEFHLCI